MEVLSKLLEALVVTLREGVEAALVIGIVLAYLGKTQQRHLDRFVYRGLLAAVGVSFLTALLLYKLGLDAENELFEGIFMLLAAALVGTFLIWMWRTSGTLKQRLEARLGQVTAAGSGVGIFCFTFVMVLREGIETVMFLLALSASIGANPFYNLLGGSLGLLLALIFGILFVKGSVRVNLKSFFGATSVVLALLLLKLVANGLHEFFEVGVLPSTPWLLAVVGFLTKKSISVLILIALIAIPAAVMLRDGLRNQAALPDPSLSEAERRKLRADVRRAKRWTATTAALALAVSTLLGVSLVAAARRGFDPAPQALAASATIRLPLAEATAQPMQKYAVDLDGAAVRFFTAVNGKGGVAVAFDACSICPVKGYSHQGDHLVCNNCGAPIALHSIGEQGGCNPIPLSAVVTEDALVIRAADLAAERDRFLR
ncbi:MAG: DUF2318 domain-containing protein [Candidatus Tectomicrobia bacterium]|nr:DUF2318 domain-containing protein [Candidatus Tectomicrobia bacterium]